MEVKIQENQAVEYYSTIQDLQEEYDEKCVIKELVKGGKNKVTLYTSKKDEKLYAIKLIEILKVYDQIEDEENLKQMFQKYLQKKQELLKKQDLVQRMQHKNIVKVHGFYERECMNKFSFYIKMDYMEQNVQHLIEQRMTLETNKAVEYLKQCGKALQYLKFHNIFHGAISPQNILIDQDDTITISDFGQADFIVQSFRNLILTDYFKQLYCSPQLYQAVYNYELLEKDFVIDHEKSDIWSLAYIFLFLTVKKFRQNSAFVNIHQIKDFQNYSNLQAEIINQIQDKDLGQILNGMINYQEADRPNYEQILQELDDKFN